MEENKEKVIAVANKYKSLYFLDEEFKNLPNEIKDELKVALVLACEKCSAIVKLFINKNNDIQVDILQDDTDYNFDEIEAKLALRDLENEKKELFYKLKIYYLYKKGILDNKKI